MLGRRIGATAVMLAVAAAGACGSDDGKKKVRGADAGAGAGGEEAAQAGQGGGPAEPVQGGGGNPNEAAAGDGGSDGHGGLAGGGVAGVPAQAGAAGDPGQAGKGGEGGEGGESSGYGNEPVLGDTFVSPTGLDGDNDCQSEATPCLTMSWAMGNAAPNQTVWLLDGAYTTTNQPATPNLVQGLRLRARTLGGAAIRHRLVMLGNDRVEGLVIDGGASGAGNPGIDIATGNVTLEGVAFSGALQAPLQVSGDAVVEILPGELTDYVATLTPPANGSSASPLLAVSGSAQVVISGGTFNGNGVGFGAVGPGAGGAALSVQGSASLTLDGVALKSRSRGIFVAGSASLILKDTTITTTAMPSAGFGVWVNSTSVAPTIQIEGGSISGFAYGANSAAIALPDYMAASTGSFSLTGTTLSNSSFGVWVHGLGTAQLTSDAVTVQNNLFGGVYCDGACALDMANSSVNDNAGFTPTPWAYYGGVSLPNANSTYTVKLRGTTIADNRNGTSDGATNADGNSGLTLAGTATSSFDLGTAADPGGNTFQGNDTGNLTTNLNVKVAAGVVVNAVGNTFDPSLQGTDAGGLFQLGTTPCLANSCAVTSGTGANYRVTSGTLVLVD